MGEGQNQKKRVPPTLFIIIGLTLLIGALVIFWPQSGPMPTPNTSETPAAAPDAQRDEPAQAPEEDDGDAYADNDDYYYDSYAVNLRDNDVFNSARRYFAAHFGDAVYLFTIDTQTQIDLAGVTCLAAYAYEETGHAPIYAIGVAIDRGGVYGFTPGQENAAARVGDIVEPADGETQYETLLANAWAALPQDIDYSITRLQLKQMGGADMLLAYFVCDADAAQNKIIAVPLSGGAAREYMP